MVLDLFAEELRTAAAPVPARFRSYVLNPLLQRQLRGIPDSVGTAVMAEVGESRGEATKFYLSEDPLDPDHIHTILQNILYIWHVRLSLTYLYRTDWTEHTCGAAMDATREMAARRGEVSDEAWAREMLSGFEIKVVRREGLGWYYSELIWLGKWLLDLLCTSQFTWS